jgi:hypothetical protein
MINAPSVASFSAVTDDGTNDKKSFADCLKETKDDSDKEDQTASTTSRPHTSPKRAASEKEPHRKTSGEASVPLVTGDVPQTQILDPRSLILSLKKSGAAGGGRSRIDSSVPAAATDGAANAASSSAPKGQVAFGVSIPQNATPKPQPPQTPSANANAVANLAAQNAQANTDGDSARGGHSNSNNGSDEPPAPITGASASAQTKEADPTATAAPLDAVSTLNTAVVHPVPAAYTQVDSIKSSAPATSAASVAAIDEPPVAPTLRTQSIEIQVPGAGDQQVDVRVSQRAGNVDVTVRTPDNDLAQSLRQHLPELSDRLSQSGVNGDVWQPAAAVAETSNGNGSTSGDNQDQAWQGQQQNQQQSRRESDSQQNQRGSNWMNQFYSEQEGR